MAPKATVSKKGARKPAAATESLVSAPAMQRPPPAESKAGSLDEMVQQENVDDARNSTPAAERAKVLDAIDAMLAGAKEAKEDAKQSDEMRLPPGRALRERRKSKELDEAAQALFRTFEKSLDRIFGEIDADGSGYIEASELRVAFEKAGKAKSEDEVAKAVAKLDLDGDGKVSLSEFKKIALWASA